MRRRSHCNCFALCLLLAGLTPTLPAFAQQALVPAETGAPLPSDPAAIALRDRVVRSYHEVRALHEKVTQRQWKIRPEDALTVEIELRYRKPNRLYLAIDYPQIGQAGRWQLIYACDGKSLTVYNGARNEFQTVKSPARLDRLVLPQALRGPEFAALLRDASPFEALEKSAPIRYSESLEERVGASWHALKLDLHQEGARRTIRYQVGLKDSLIHGFTISILPDLDAASPFLDPEVKSGVEATYTLVDTAPHFTDADFRFSPPVGAKEDKPRQIKPAGDKPKPPAGPDERRQ